MACYAISMVKSMMVKLIFSLALVTSTCRSEYSSWRQCEPIRIEMCRNIGYNETSMPNFVGNELQSEVEYTLQSFRPLIEYVCSAQLRLFLCATYVPMCTTKVSVPIGPCRTLCENVRSRCHPVLQEFGYPWPPALDCNLFPLQNNQETMCMEGPGEPAANDHLSPSVHETDLNYNQEVTVVKQPVKPFNSNLGCPGYAKVYRRLHRTGRCAPLCDANVLFSEQQKHLAAIWTISWSYIVLGIALTSIILMMIGEKRTKVELIRSRILAPLMWCHTLVVIGWCIRFVAGRHATSCGIDPQLPNVSLLLVDGLSNIFCAATFILRYYFGMAACAWWAILCLGWHCNVRRQNLDALESSSAFDTAFLNAKPTTTTGSLHTSVGMMVGGGKLNTPQHDITRHNLARFLGWGLPAFQTAAVIIGRLVDADELIGACYVGNQSDKGLQILVTTPLFCYWIFGTMNLSSGYLVYRHNKAHLHRTTKQLLANAYLIPNHKLLHNSKQNYYHTHHPNSLTSISGVFLFVYCLPYTLLLLAVIYEFANIDVWLNATPFLNRNGLKATTTPIESTTPMWPFLTRVFMELILGVICSIWILGPKISSICRQQAQRQQTTTTARRKKTNTSPRSIENYVNETQSIGNRTCSLTAKSSSSVTASHQSILRPPLKAPHPYLSSAPVCQVPPVSSSISLNPIVATRSLQRVGNFTRIMYPQPVKVHKKRQGSSSMDNQLSGSIISSCNTETIL